MKHLLRYTLLLLTALLPLLAMAEGEKIDLNKYVTENPDGTYTLDLETYATGWTKQTEMYVPTDFVLVLDRSGSMDTKFSGTSTSRIAALREAVANFIDLVFDNNPEGTQKHRISVVWYAGLDAGSGTTLTPKIAPNIGYDYQLVEMTSPTVRDNYKAGIEASRGYYEDPFYGRGNPEDLGSATLCDVGLQKAYSILKGTDPVDTDGEDRNKVILFFTDGEPGYARNFHVKTASNTCRTAAQFKADTDLNNTPTGASTNTKTFKPIVYCIGLMDSGTSEHHNFWDDGWKAEKDPVPNDIFRFLNYVSSNYLISEDAFASETYKGKYTFSADLATTVAVPQDADYTGTSNGSEDAHGYFLRANSALDLKNAFSKIATNELKDRNELLTDATVVLDGITENFKLPDGTVDIRLYTCAADEDHTGTTVKWSTSGTTGDGGQLIYKDASNHKQASSTGAHHSEYWIPFKGITPTVSGKEVSVTGYNFKEHFVGPKRDFTDDAGGTGANIFGWSGEKLIVEFDIVRDPANPGGEIDMQTNTATSGVYVSGTNIKYYDVPKVPVPNIIITKTGLTTGESAVFEVERVTDSGGSTPDGTNVFKNTYILTKTDISIEPSIEFVASGPGFYKVTEKTWTWNDVVTYGSGTEGTSYVQELKRTDTQKTFTFGVKSGYKTTILERHNDEKNKNNVF